MSVFIASPKSVFPQPAPIDLWFAFLRIEPFAPFVSRFCFAVAFPAVAFPPVAFPVVAFPAAVLPVAFPAVALVALPPVAFPAVAFPPVPFSPLPRSMSFRISFLPPHPTVPHSRRPFNARHTTFLRTPSWKNSPSSSAEKTDNSFF